MATYQRTLAVLLLLTFCATWLPSSAQAVTASQPSASEILLDVAAHSPNLIIRLNTYDDVTNLNIDPFVRVKMIYAIAYGSWIVTTRTPVTSGKWTGRPWLAIGGHARYFYFAYETLPDGSEVGDMGGVVGLADGKAISEFGANLTDIGMGLAALGAAKGGPAGKAAASIGLGIAGLGIAVNTVGLGIQVVEDVTAPSPKQGHVDTAPSGGGPAGSAPSGPTGGPGPNGEGPGAVSTAPPGFGQSIGLTGPDGSTAGGGAGASAPGPSGGGGSTGDSGVGDE